ncbi:MAG: phosphate ABC transporter permease PstA [Fimbriimonas sp.]
MIQKSRKAKDTVFAAACLMATLVAALVLVALLWSVVSQGLSRIRPDFFTSFTSRIADRAGIKAALMGTIWIVVLTGVIAIPIGVAAAVYLEEFAQRKSRWANLIEINISNLAGVPSILYGLLGLAAFVRWADLGRSVIAGALTMSLLILPTIILVTREALRAVPSSYRDGSLALGSTRWQSIRRVVLPSASPGILTGIILSLSRAMGETAPLLTIGAVSYISFVPKGLGDKFTILPMQVFEWSSRPQAGFHEAAAAAIIVLLAVLLLLNSFAIVIRHRAASRLPKHA